MAEDIPYMTLGAVNMGPATLSILILVNTDRDGCTAGQSVNGCVYNQIKGFQLRA